MPSLSNVQRRILVHLTEEHRKKIQQNIQSKRVVFIKMVSEGIVEMLNTQDEQRALQENKVKLSSFFSKRSEERKANIDAAADAVKSTARGAPMGAELGANAAVTVLSAAAMAYENRTESVRVLEEAQEEYRSAQILHYIPVSKKDYKPIGDRVATVLADRLACALFRLAAGENGVLVLSKFLLISMNMYAIKRLRQHESTREEIIKALIDAAIPPPSDRFNYVGWPTVSYSNSSLHLLLHKTLARDPYADEIIAFSGPAVRVIFGGHECRVDLQTGKNLFYQNYTIQGILYHAPIVTDQNVVVRGLEIGNRKNEELLDGSTKYPIIMLRPGETIADLGSNFVPEDKSETLEPEQEEVILRIFPKRPIAPSVSRSDTGRANKDFCYINEKYEVPWGRNRAQRMQQRASVTYNAGKQVSPTWAGGIVTSADYHRLRAQQIAIHQFDAEEALEDAKVVTKEALDARTELCATDITALDRHRKHLRAIMASKYATLAATALIDCCVDGHLLEETYLTAATNAAEAARAALNAIRRSPVEEANDYQKILIASQKIAQLSDEVFNTFVVCQEDFQMMVGVVKKSPFFALARKFSDTERTILAANIKKTKRLVRQQVKESEELSMLATTVATYRPKGDDASTFQQIADEIRSDLNTASFSGDAAVIIKTIELCVIVTKRNYDAMQWILETCEYTVVPSDGETSDESASSSTLGHEFAPILADAHTQAVQSLAAANAYLAGISSWHKKTNSYVVINEPLRPHLEAAVAAKKRSKELFARVEYKKNTDPDSTLTTMVKDFFIYAKTAAEQGRLHFSVRHKETKAPGSATSTQLDEKLTTLDNLAGLLNLAAKERNALLAEQAYQSAVSTGKDLYDDMPLGEFLQKTRQIKQAKAAVESAVTNDEVTDLLDKAQLAVTEMERSLQAIVDRSGKLFYLQQKCFSGSMIMSPRSNSTASLPILEEPDSNKEQSPSRPSLEKLSLAFQAEDIDQIIFEGLSEYEAEIATGILQLYQSYVRLGTSISFKQFMSKVQEKIRCVTNKPNFEMLYENWGIWLVIDTALWMIEQMQLTQIIEEKINEAKQALAVILQISIKEPPDLKIARKSALVSLKKAYAHLAEARKKQACSARDPDNQKPLFVNLGRTTMRWAGRFNSEEHKWWQKEHSGDFSFKLVDAKFPARLAYAFFRTYSKQKLTEVKAQVGELNIIKKKLKEYARQLNISAGDSVLLGRSQPIAPKALAQLKESHTTLSKIVDTTLHQLMLIKEDTSVLKKTIVKREVAPYFNQWRENSLGTKPKRPEITEIEADDRPESYDLDKIRVMFNLLTGELRTAYSSLFSSSSYFLLPPNQQASPTLRSLTSSQIGVFSKTTIGREESPDGSQDNLEHDATRLEETAYAADV